MSKNKGSLRRIEHWKVIAFFLAIYDALAVNLAYFLALWFRFDCSYSAIAPEYLKSFVCFSPIYTAVSLFIIWRIRLYNSIWRFASFNEMLRTAAASGIASAFHTVGLTVLFGRMPISYYLVGAVVQFMLVLGVRFSYRFILLERKIRHNMKNTASAKRVMLIGAGEAGQMILRDVAKFDGEQLTVSCIIDDNSNKWGRYIDGVPVVGGREDILLNAEKYHIDLIFVAIPSASQEQIRDILNICKETGCKLKNLPGYYQLINDRVSIGDMRDVAVEDLLGRDQIKVSLDEISLSITGKVVLVTGGGGSIGSELCRQIAAQQPKQLLIFDVYENNAYEIEQELREKYPKLNLVALIGSVRDSRRINHVFAAYRPEIVYHAAAHKHVPLMEVSPCEAIKNNVIGTYKTAYAAMVYGCRRFVLISTDKAVNPTNIMGASKRLCEMVIQSLDRAVKTGIVAEIPMLFTHSADEMFDHQPATGASNFCTEFVAVRFGNVLGSNGSVIPLFKKQIAKGGPVTVTHPDIIRYFMTIPEAVSLVLQAGTYAKGGEIFVLDMGAPVKIDELARNLIKLSGFKPGVDIQIIYTGLRPGEKLFEEKLMAEEGMGKTPNNLIHIGKPIPLDTNSFLHQLRDLMNAAYRNDAEIGKMVANMVPTYHPAPNGSEHKGRTYEELNREAVAAGR